MAVKIDTQKFFSLWKDREKQIGKTLTLTEASGATELAAETIRNIREGKTARYDAPVIDQLCKLLNLPHGPVPFIIYEPDE